MPDPQPSHFGRRAFLVLTAGGLSSFAWAGWASRVFSPVTSQFSQLLADFLPVGGWRIYTISGSMPVFDPKAWRLEVTGLVAKPRSFTYDELLALPRAEQITTFHCVTGWTVKNVHWAGVRIKDVLAAAAPSSRAHALRFVSAENPYVDYLTLQQAELHDVMLAYEMDGKPLPREHGAPLRLVIPEMYGYKNVKWLKRVELVPAVGSGYWEQLGYDQNAWVGRSNGY